MNNNIPLEVLAPVQLFVMLFQYVRMLWLTVTTKKNPMPNKEVLNQELNV